MSEEEWERFSSDVVRILRSNTESIHFVGWGQGVYEGMTEESFTVIASDPSHTALAAIRVSLAYMCDAYGQEAIAVSQGDPTYVTPYGIGNRKRVKAKR